MNAASSSSTDPRESRSYVKPAIRPDMTVRQVATDYPACRQIFVEYGEPADRPGRFGHFQPLTYFARSHGLDLDRLLDRLSQAAGVPVDRWNKTAERIHRNFIVAALGITLTLGAGWGGWLLWSIGIHHDFHAASAAHIVAHGEAQLWGFIGLFIVGISLRTVLIDAVRSRLTQRVCTALFGVSLLSLVAGFAWSLAPGTLWAIGPASAVALLGLSLAFWLVQIRLLWPKWKATWARAVIVSGFWLTTWAATTLLLRSQAADVGPGSFSMTTRMLLIELAVFGFAMNSIYGFGQMLLPGLQRTGRTRQWAIEAAFWLHNAGVAIVVAGSSSVAPQWLAAAGLAAMAAGTILYAIGQHIFIGKPRTSHRPEQGHRLLDAYIPLAFFWLALSMLLLAGSHIYGLVFQVAPPHAFVGAVRHALTVGFMTTLILGVGQRLLPVLEHTILRRPGLVAPILLLIALGNLLRVATEMLIQQWLLAQPPMREFLQSRTMIPYDEGWMGQVDAMKKLMGWTDVSVIHFHNLAVFGEKILLSIRYGDWSDPAALANQAANWALYFRPEIQGYLESYRAVTGVDLSADVQRLDRVDATLPGTLLQQRLRRTGTPTK